MNIWTVCIWLMDPCRYVTVDEDAGRALFYTFVESSGSSEEDPLVLWLNGCVAQHSDTREVELQRPPNISAQVQIPWLAFVTGQTFAVVGQGALAWLAGF